MRTRERIKAWVTKYALTHGILTAESEVSGQSPDMIRFFWGEPSGMLYVHGGDWHRTEEAAIQRAEEMRTRKIASLRKQIAKLEAMTFVQGAA